MNSFRSILVLSVFVLSVLAAANEQQLIQDPTLMDAVGSGPFMPTDATFVQNNAGGGYILDMGAAFGSQNPHSGGKVCQTVTTPAVFMDAEMHLMASGQGAISFTLDGSPITTAVGDYDAKFSVTQDFKPSGSTHTICAENLSTTGNSLLTLVSVEYSDAKVSCRSPRGITGKTGPYHKTGKTGHSGPDGPSGPHGPTGGDCPSGETGVTGPTGESNPSGNDNPSGKTEASGPDNKSGVTGATGPDGKTGPTGMDNPTGVSSINNPSGISNPTGVDNKSGIDNPTGKDNPSGKDNKRGKYRKFGKTGPTGKFGKTGKTGKDNKH